MDLQNKVPHISSELLTSNLKRTEHWMSTEWIKLVDIWKRNNSHHLRLLGIPDGESQDPHLGDPLLGEVNIEVDRGVEDSQEVWHLQISILIRMSKFRGKEQDTCVQCCTHSGQEKESLQIREYNQCRSTSTLIVQNSCGNHRITPWWPQHRMTQLWWLWVTKNDLRASR